MKNKKVTITIGVSLAVLGTLMLSLGAYLLPKGGSR